MGAHFSVLASFYYGNITHPSVDPPRVGFMSTVPNDANNQFTSAFAAAQANNGFPSNIYAHSVDFTGYTDIPRSTFVAKSESAPPGDPSIATTISGVPQAVTTNPIAGGNSGTNAHSSAGRTVVGLSSWSCLVATVLCVWWVS